MTNHTKTTAPATPSQDPAKKPQTLKIKLGKPTTWSSAAPCAAFIL